MKKFLFIVCSLALSFLSAGCGPIHLEWVTTRGGKGVPVVIQLETYYAAFPQFEVPLIVVMDTSGKEIHDEVAWRVEPAEIGDLVVLFLDQPETQRYFIPKQAGECTIIAEVGNQITTTHVVIFPRLEVPAGVTVDFDGDGKEDINLYDIAHLIFPYGGHTFSHSSPYSNTETGLGNLPKDFELEGIGGVGLYNDYATGCLIAFNTSNGETYAAVMYLSPENRTATFCYRKLR